MGERDMSPEREAGIRQALAETEARDLDSADNAIADLLAMLDVSRGREHGPCDEIRLRHATERAETLLAEIDRLRALPVIATCGQCGHAPSRYARPRVCQHPVLFDREDPVLLAVEHADAPPAGCPLRGER